MAAPDIDLALLPARAVFDTGVVIRALGERRREPISALCEAIWNAMLQSRRQILVAAPSVAEMIRNSGTNPLPHRRGIEVVGFDQRAAELLGATFPETFLVETAKAWGAPVHYVKYDALIVATAARHRATHVIAIDEGVRRLAKQAGLTGLHPNEMKGTQASLPFDSDS